MIAPSTSTGNAVWAHFVAICRHGTLRNNHTRVTASFTIELESSRARVDQQLDFGGNNTWGRIRIGSGTKLQDKRILTTWKVLYAYIYAMYRKNELWWRGVRITSMNDKLRFRRAFPGPVRIVNEFPGGPAMTIEIWRDFRCVYSVVLSNKRERMITLQYTVWALVALNVLWQIIIFCSKKVSYKTPAG